MARCSLNLAIAGVLLLLAGASLAAQDDLGAVRFLEGSWTCENKGVPGEGKGERSYAFVLRGRFLEGRNRTVYPQTEKNKGEVHEDRSLFSYDRARKTIVLRQFHAEGFVNQYVCVQKQEGTVCETEAIENIAPGWKARVSWRQAEGGELVETFELAAPGKEYSIYSTARLKKKN